MAKTQLDAGFSRRDSLRLVSLTGLAVWAESSAFAASDFWNKKKPGEWTDQEKDELRTKSPWAKKVEAESSGGGRGGGGGEDGGSGGGGGGSRGGGGGGGGSRGGGGGGGGGLVPANPGGGPATPLSIVWESAKPIQDAHPLALPPKLDNHYVIAVTGVPQRTLTATVMGARGGRGGGRPGGNQNVAEAGPPPGTTNIDTVNAAPPDPTAGLRQGTTLTVKGKPPQNADIVLSTNNNATLLFGFTKDVLALAATDKEVEFDLKLTGLAAKAKFNLKDMMYGEQLAL